MEIIGKLTKVGNIQTFESGFKKREIIVTTDEQYPQPIAIELLQEKTELIEKFKINVGDNVKVAINLRGREWTNPEGVVKYFNSIVGWRIDKQEAMEQGVAEDDLAPQDDDLPF